MVRHTISHALPLDEAKQLVERAFTHYRERHPSYEPALTFRDARHGEIQVSIRGYKLKARIEITLDALLVEMDIPLLLRPFQGAALRAVDREANRWLKPDSQT